MKILLFTLNSRFSHSSLALRYIRAFWDLYSDRYPDVFVERLEYSINTDLDYVLSRIAGTYDVIFVSTYIWNIESYRVLFRNLRRIDSAAVILGGPEVSYAEEIPDFADAVIRGEGEEAFVRFVSIACEEGLDRAIADARALFASRRIHKLERIEAVPFPYRTDDDSTRNRTIYYESSRGCPYRCSYCLSSVDPGVRYLPLERVLEEIDFFIDRGFRIVKFVDRTFNARADRFEAIVRHIIDRDRGLTAFHFEINAGLLSDSQIELLAQARPGLFKLEAGIQSTHAETIRAIDRRIDTDAVLDRCIRLVERTAVHLHVDLIAGLPFESRERFLRSFDEVFAIGADQFQLGFLKVLDGTPMAGRAADYGIVTRVNAPYEVLATRWMSASDLRTLKRLERTMDSVHNGRMPHTIDYLVRERYGRPSALYVALSEHLEAEGGFEGGLSPENAYRMLLRFSAPQDSPGHVSLKALLILDYILYGPESRPEWLCADVEKSLRARKRLLAEESIVGPLRAEFGADFDREPGAWRLEWMPSELPEALDRCTIRSPRARVRRFERDLPDDVAPAPQPGLDLYLIHRGARIVVRLARRRFPDADLI